MKEDKSLLKFMPVVEAAKVRTVAYSSRYLLYALCGVFLVLFLWMAFATIDEKVQAQGQVIPSQRVQHIQNLEGGIIQEILVAEGEEVLEGAVLLRIDNVAADTIYRDSIAREQELSAMVARLEAELKDEEALYPYNLHEENPELIARHNQLLLARQERNEAILASLASQLEAAKLEEQELVARQKQLLDNLAILEEKHTLAEKLLETRSYSEMDYLELSQQKASLEGDLRILESSLPKAKASIEEVRKSLESQKAQIQSVLMEEFNAAKAELSAISKTLVANKDRVSRTEVKSPVHGMVKSINVTTEGGVIMPGQVIMDIVPMDDSLLIEAKILPQDRAFLFEGQDARIRLSAYDFSIYGALEAKLVHIGADTVEDRQGNLYYRARLETKESTLKHNGKELPILPGMIAIADIITGERTILQYILKPLFKAREDALSEK